VLLPDHLRADAGDDAVSVRRRTALLGLGAAALAGRACPCAAAAGYRSRGGCYVAPEEFQRVLAGNLPPAKAKEWDVERDPILNDSGRGRAFEAALGDLLVFMSTTYGVRPGFGFYDDVAGMNALATPYTRIARTRGTVVFGRRLLGHLLDGDGDIAVAAVCAHELAHILQFDRDDHRRLQASLPGYCTELHADFLAGAFLHRLEADRPSIDLLGAGRAWSRLGSSDFNDPKSHGTSRQRVAAIEAGYFTARDRPGAGMTDLAEAGFEHVHAYAG
jgi:hypothetical protein